MITRIEKLAWNKNTKEVEQIREAIPFEVKKLLNHMEGLSEERMITSLERNLNNLYIAYFSIDKEIRELPKEERDNLRPIKNVIYEVICELTNRAKFEIKIECSQEFIYSWINKVEYFPFEEVREIKIDTRYKGIAKQLSRWISGTNDEVLSEIFTKKKLPARRVKPKFCGKQTEAFYLMDKLNMIYPSDFKECFDFETELHIKNKPKEGTIPRKGSLYYTLKDI